MSVKERLIRAVGALPQDATWEQAEEMFRLLHALDQAEAEIDAGNFVTQEAVERDLETWLQK